ncbi:hypothetical protein RUM44_013732 [Polyplax serrata]|uniref:Uncharacterized protein n=1 Tax=Polyplax serrata TaxID=468196 RepID=A0ABR1BIX6_POLSC
MSESPLEQVIVQLNQVDVNKSDFNNFNYQNLLEKICCNNLKRIECKTHFLTSDLMTALCDSLQSSNPSKIVNGAHFVAELGKYDTCREFISNPLLISLLINHLKSSNIDVLIQTCRALANICFEKSDAQNLIVSQGALKQISNLLEKCTVPNAVENNVKFKATLIGLFLNLIAENESIHAQVFEQNLLAVFISLIEKDLESNLGTGIAQNIFVILVALTETIASESVFTDDICRLAVKMFSTSFNDDFCVTGLDFLEDAELPDPVKFNLAKAGLFQLFIEFLEKKPATLTEDEVNKYDLTGRVLANILTGDEAMEYLYEVNDGVIMTHLTAWLSSEDKELVHTAVLCIGNIARTDRHSTSIVEKEIHKLLLNILKDGSNDIKMQYAVISTIRNLSIPRINKVRLVKDGLIDVLIPLMDLDVKTSSAVIFKLVGTLRQVIDGQELLALDLGCNENIIKKLSTWASLTIHPWVSSECCRCLCWLVKISKDRNVILNALRNGSYTHILKLLGALHGLMQSEAVSALTVTSAIVLLELERSKHLEKNGEPDEEDQETKVEQDLEKAEFSDFERVLVSGEIGEKLKHLIMQHGVKMDEHILENIFTFLEIVTKFGKFDHLNFDLYMEFNGYSLEEIHIY